MWLIVIVLVIGLVYLEQSVSRKVNVKEDITSDMINTDRIEEKAGSCSKDKKELTFEEQKKNKELSARNNYTKRESIWGSNAEKSIYKAIKDINRDTLIVLPHISLNEIFEAKPDDRYGNSRKKYIKYYHVDFLICEKENLIPLLGIEVDGKHHVNIEQQLSDVFKDEIFKSNNIPLLRIKDSYRLEQIVNDIKDILNKAPVYCGKCGAEMILRKGIEGKDSFYGCSCYKLNRCIYKRDKDFKYVS